MKGTTVKRYRDRETGARHRVGDVISASAERMAVLVAAGVVVALPAKAAKGEPTKKDKPKLPDAAQAKPSEGTSEDSTSTD